MGKAKLKSAEEQKEAITYARGYRDGLADAGIEMCSLRAELAAERKLRNQAIDDFDARLKQEIASRDKTISERDALRELLKEARDYIDWDQGAGLRTRIDAALAKGDE